MAIIIFYYVKAIIIFEASHTQRTRMKIVHTNHITDYHNIEWKWK